MTNFERLKLRAQYLRLKDTQECDVRTAQAAVRVRGSEEDHTRLTKAQTNLEETQTILASTY